MNREMVNTVQKMTSALKMISSASLLKKSDIQRESGPRFGGGKPG